MSQKNSFISMLEQIAVLNKNSVEIISKLNDVVGTTASNITVNYLNNDGNKSVFQLPTIGFLKQQIDVANSNIKKLSGLDNSETVVISDSNSSRKIKSIKLNREPNQISNINVVSNFNQSNNWFFESLINPLLSIEINLDEKIDETVKKVLCRRYIIQFEKDENDVYTSAGLLSKQIFEEKYLYKNDISIGDFQNWLNSPTNIGVLKENEYQYIDEQLFDLNYKEIEYKGYFSVLRFENDTLNRKLWYHLNSITYYDRNGGTRTLAIGDILSTTKSNSYTLWKIIEINTSSSLFRVNLERIEGYDPVSIGTNMLQFYSPLTTNNKIKVSIGFDEYNILFLKPINTDNNIIGSTWSKGMSYYTNDLTLGTDTNVSMADFYLNKVYDYGAILKDLVVKNIPSKFASKPNIPELLSENFKVVQINKHLTDTKDYKTLKKLHGQKNSIKTKINQVNDAIIEKNKELNVKQFKSVAERSKSQNELNELITKQQSDTKLYSSYVNQITNSTAEPTALPKFRIRGFWEMPNPIIKQGFKPQEVIGFEIQWRYGSKFGTENITEGFELKRTNTLTSSLSAEKPKFLKKTGYFSGWNKLKTDIRDRVYDNSTGEWYWKVEDISDADTPNINQMDISITKQEKVEIRIRSISEVGYPDSPIYSDWSEIITVDFPSELSDVLGDSDFILKEASQEEVKVQFENELSSKGISKHVVDSYYVNEQYVAHTDKVISTSFKDSFGNSLSLFDYLTQMTNKIAILEESILRAKGELKVTLFRGTSETEIKNGASIYSNIECEDYMETYIPDYQSEPNHLYVKNHIYMISDFYIKIENIAKENPLGLLTSLRTSIDSISSIEKVTFVDQEGNLKGQVDNQYVWFMLKTNIDGAEKILYGSGTTELYGTGSTVVTDYSNFYSNDTTISTVLDPDIWSPTNITTIDEGDSYFLGASVYPKLVVNSTTNQLVDYNNENLHILNAQESLIIPLNLYFKPNCQDETSVDIDINKSWTTKNRKKSLRLLLNPENSARAFDFTITFNFKSHKQYSSGNNFNMQHTINGVQNFG